MNKKKELDHKIEFELLLKILYNVSHAQWNRFEMYGVVQLSPLAISSSLDLIARSPSLIYVTIN